MIKRNHVYTGDAISVLATLPEKPVDPDVTPPAYFGVRSYVDDDGEHESVKPLIWDATTPGCVHDWDKIDPLRRWTPGDLPGPNAKASQRRGKAENRPGMESFFCKSCGCWLGHFGNEPSPDLYIKHLCDILDHVKRVLKDEGSLWVNIGDSYAQSGGAGGDWNHGKRASAPKWKQNTQYLDVGRKSCIGIPERFVIEMITKRGWILRSKHPWIKGKIEDDDTITPESMPNSQKDRDTVDHEIVFCFVKPCKNRYFTNSKTLRIQREKPQGSKGVEGVDWDWQECDHCNGKGTVLDKNAINMTNGLFAFSETLGLQKPESPKRVECKRCKGSGRVKRNYWMSHDYFYAQQFEPLKKPNTKGSPFGGTKRAHGDNATYSGRVYDASTMTIGRITRTTWFFGTNKYHGSHHATYPVELPMRAIRRGCPAWVCKKCGLPRQPVIETVPVDKTDGDAVMVKQLGFTDCKCNAGWIHGLTIDMFFGSGTSALAAINLNRDWIGIEINPMYAAEARTNIFGQPVKKTDTVVDHRPMTKLFQ